MREAEHVIELREELVSVYGEDRVESEPLLTQDGARRQADLGVYESAGRDNWLLVVECKAGTDSADLDTAVNQAQEFRRMGDAPFGMVSAPGRKYIFDTVELGSNEFERSFPELPQGPDDRDQEPRPFDSETEMEFFVQRALGLSHRWSDDPEDALDHVLQNLYRKFFAETHDLALDPGKDLRTQLDQVDQRIESDLDIYGSELSPSDSPAAYATICLLDAFSIAETSDELKEQLVDYFADGLPSIDRFTTPTEVAEFLVGIAQVESGQEVLDPASGLGNLSRQLAARNTDVTAVELNTRVANFAAFLNYFLDFEIDIINTDFLTLYPEPEQQILTDESTFSNTSSISISIGDQFDHVVVDVPFGNLKSEDPNYREQLQEELITATGKFNTEDVFIEKALRHLKESGTLTALIPQGVLYRDSAQTLRELILEDYTLSRVLVFEEAGFAPHTDIPTAVIQVENKDQHQYDIEFATITLKDETSIPTPQEVNENTTAVDVTNVRDTLVPDSVLKQLSAQDSLLNTFQNITELGEFVSNIRSGVNVDRADLVQENDLDYIQFPRKGSEPNIDYQVANAENYFTAQPGDLLVSTKGTVGEVYVPDRKVIPDSNWAVLRFDNEQTAKAYAAFLRSSYGREQVNSLTRGTRIPYITVNDLSSIPVPVFSDENINKLASQFEQASPSDPADQWDDLLQEVVHNE